MRVAIYARVSTEEQTEQNQVPILKAWAANRGFEVVEVYHDTGSAYQGNDLLQQKRMMTDARMGKFKKIVVWSLDRLTRRGSTALGMLLQQLETWGCHVVSMQQDFTDVPDALYPMLISIYGFWGKYESQMISQRTKAGMVRAAINGTKSGKPIGRPRKKGVKIMTPLSPLPGENKDNEKREPFSGGTNEL
jgi:DNA invertase Pin-like site-specific DNA recombinase